jgi:hypothetical protein
MRTSPEHAPNSALPPAFLLTPKIVKQCEQKHLQRCKLCDGLVATRPASYSPVKGHGAQGHVSHARKPWPGAQLRHRWAEQTCRLNLSRSAGGAAARAQMHRAAHLVLPGTATPFQPLSTLKRPPLMRFGIPQAALIARTYSRTNMSMLFADATSCYRLTGCGPRAPVGAVAFPFWRVPSGQR